MTDWKVQYLISLEARDKTEKQHEDFYETYVKLADRAASHYSEGQPTVSSPMAADTPASPALPFIPPSPIIGRRGSKPIPTPSLPDPELLSQLRTDLLTAQTARTSLQAELTQAQSQLATIQSIQKFSSKRLGALQTQVTTLTQRLRDLTEELRGKAKLLEDVQDENATLNLQLNVADEQAQKLRTENKELVDRWMKKVGDEAERMNERGGFG